MSIYYKADSQPGRLGIITRKINYCNTIYEQTINSIMNTNEEMISKSIEIQLPRTYAPPYHSYIQLIFPDIFFVVFPMFCLVHEQLI